MEFISERRAMTQAWADYMDEFREKKVQQEAGVA